jgi:alkylation response protein AidB-like acyl-CoA dehydrogenase
MPITGDTPTHAAQRRVLVLRRAETNSQEEPVAKLAQTAGLTEIQQEILSTVRKFVDKEIIPHATALEHEDAYPQDIVDGMKEMGLFGLMIPEEFGGLGESLLTYALVVEQIARGWMRSTPTSSWRT